MSFCSCVFVCVCVSFCMFLCACVFFLGAYQFGFVCMCLCVFESVSLNIVSVVDFFLVSVWFLHVFLSVPISE